MTPRPPAREAWDEKLPSGEDAMLAGTGIRTPRPLGSVLMAPNPMPMPPNQATFANDMALPGPYQTVLPLSHELLFKQWVKKNKIPFEDTPNADYDMRGFWKAMQQGKVATGMGADGTIHFPDTFKTPYHKTFSRESMYATEKAPKWIGDKLVDRLGNVLVDETNK